MSTQFILFIEDKDDRYITVIVSSSDMDMRKRGTHMHQC